jgi:thioglycine synthase
MIVDLTIAEIGIPVARAIVPGLENFKYTKSIIGCSHLKEEMSRI